MSSVNLLHYNVTHLYLPPVTVLVQQTVAYKSVASICKHHLQEKQMSHFIACVLAKVSVVGGGLVSTHAQHHVVLIFDILPKIKLFAAAAPLKDLRTLPKTLIGWGYKEWTPLSPYFLDTSVPRFQRLRCFDSSSDRPAS